MKILEDIVYIKDTEKIYPYIDKLFDSLSIDKKGYERGYVPSEEYLYNWEVIHTVKNEEMGFDVSICQREILGKLRKIVVDSITLEHYQEATRVDILYLGKIYPRYDTLFKQWNISNKGFLRNYEPEEEDLKDWKVEFFGKHFTLKNTYLLVISKNINGKYHKIIIGSEGASIKSSIGNNFTLQTNNVWSQI